MKTQTIEVEGLPEGWKATKITLSRDTYNGKSPDLIIYEADVRVEKIPPCRIAFYEITDGSQDIYKDMFRDAKWWREVKENDITLNSDQSKLSVDEWDFIISYLFKSGIDRKLFGKLEKFIKENS